MIIGLSGHCCSHLILTCWPIMQKVRSYYYLIFTRAAYKTTTSILSFTVLFHYRLYIIFSLRGRFPLYSNRFCPFYFLSDKKILFMSNLKNISCFNLKYCLILSHFYLYFSLFQLLIFLHPDLFFSFFFFRVLLFFL